MTGAELGTAVFWFASMVSLADWVGKGQDERIADEDAGGMAVAGSVFAGFGL